MNSKNQTQLLMVSLGFLITLIGAIWASRRAPEGTGNWPANIGFPASEIDSIAIKSGRVPAEFPAFSLRREGPAWRLQISGSEFDWPHGEGLASSLASMELSPALGTDPTEGFGLRSPVYIVEIVPAGGVKTTVLIGDETPGGQSVYVYVDGKVKISRTRLQDTVLQNLEDLPIPDGSP